MILQVDYTSKVYKQHMRRLLLEIRVGIKYEQYLKRQFPPAICNLRLDGAILA